MGHTEGSKPIAVPPHLVEGKGYVEVNRLFLALHDAGYRVVSREMNEVDEKCAEFVLVNVNEASSWEMAASGRRRRVYVQSAEPLAGQLRARIVLVQCGK